MSNWFFLMAPEAYRAPLVLLATAATIIASQAVITGAFSLTNQAMQLGLLPRMTVLRTSPTQAGEIYMPQINLMLAIGVVLLIAVFKTSSDLSHAYGLAVTGTMAVTTSLAFIVVRRKWKWSLWQALLLIGPLFAIDMVFLGANALKVFSGGFVPLILGGAIFTLMATWVRGTALIAEKVAAESVPLEDMVPVFATSSAYRAEGTAVFLTSDPDLTPAALLHESQAQPGHPQEQPDRQHPHCRCPQGFGIRARLDPEAVGRLYPDLPDLWLHGNTQCAKGPGGAAQEGRGL